MALPSAPDFTLTLITRDPAWAGVADAAGVDRIGIDVERLDKARRQGHIAAARISDHEIEDLGIIAPLVRNARLFARLNPLHPGTRDEVDRAVGLGAQSLMLPGFRHAREAAQFIDHVGGRAETMLLVETSDAVARLPEIVALPGIGEIMVGLNDLRLDMQLRSPFEVAASDLMRSIAGTVLDAGIRFGFGGVAQPETAGLPVPPDLVLARYAQIGARSAWISRSFFSGGLIPAEFGPAIANLRSRLAFWFSQSPAELAAAGKRLRKAVRDSLA